MKTAKSLVRLKEKTVLSTETSLKRRDYSVYKWTKSEFLFAIVETCTVVIFVSYFFYRSVLAAILLIPLGVVFFKEIVEKKKRKLQELLTQQFKECILSVSASLKAGYAVENAFMESRGDMKLLYGENSLIYKELELIRRGLIVNLTLEELLADFAQRSHSQEIYQFSQIFAIAKRNGGNLPEIIRFSAELIGHKIDTTQEINTVLSGRRMEQNIMKMMPFGILAYIGMTYPGYFDSLYHNLKGIMIMTGCLIIYVAAFVAGDKILRRIEQEMM